ncbi:MAG: dihydrodipicolinate synthase family protein [Bryobacterales bacterium]|jgi:4-hydroxy-tetrahydrodipicolinate synthase|nr:dihydrodipicolinate synthase family protein [Bryobacterales bacterium]
MPALITGVYAAIFTPRDEHGEIADDVLEGHARWLLQSGVQGLVVGGATAEYVFADESEARRLVEAVADIAGRHRFIAGIGGGTVQQCIRRGQHAMDCGARALLLPAPHFFPYSPEDVATFARHVANHVNGPVLLYQLPQFSNGYSTEHALGLLHTEDAVVGIKDSSGSLELLRDLTERGAAGVSRIVGNDSVLVRGRREGVCDAVISGVSAALPDLIVALFDAASVDSETEPPLAFLLDEVIQQLNGFPVPWGLKWIAEARGLGPFGSPLPISPQRQDEARALREWLRDFLPRLAHALADHALSSTEIPVAGR